MSKYILAWDVETTGLNAKEDFIIQLAAARFDKETGAFIDGKKWYIKPAHNYTINPKAQEVHGLTKEFIDANGIYFKDVAPTFFSMMGDADLLTYNGNTFDIKFLYEECKRWNIDMPIFGKKFYDAYAIECKMTPRDLSTTYKKYMGEELENAHDALSDVVATGKVFFAQQEMYGLKYDDIDNWDENNLLTPDGSIRKSYNGTIIFAVGKYRDSEYMEICRKDPGYIKWFMENVASNYTQNILREYYAKNR